MLYYHGCNDLLSELLVRISIWVYDDNATSENWFNGPADLLHRLLSLELAPLKQRYMKLFAITLQA